jgi:hypothetical protein
MNKLYLNQLPFFAKVTSKLRVIPNGSQILYEWYVDYFGLDYFMVLHVVSYFDEARKKGALFAVQQSSSGPSRLIFNVSRSYSATPHSVGFLWTKDRPVAETSIRKHTAFTRDKHAFLRRDSNPPFQQASGRRPTARPQRCITLAMYREFVSKNDIQEGDNRYEEQTK